VTNTQSAGQTGPAATPASVRKYTPWRTPAFYLALLIVTATVVLAAGIGQGWWVFNQKIGPLTLHHWLAIAGAAFFAVYTPIYAALKQRYPERFSRLVNVHAFGNLLAFLLVTAHFVRFVKLLPVLGNTGLTLYIVTAILVLTGITQRFRLAGRWTRRVRFVHVGMALAFYVVLGVHVWHTLLSLGII